MDSSISSLSAHEIFIFLGPTLSLEEANAILPARYLEPARCGDILSYLRLKPKVFALIDGVFDRNASVWHKEILWAMEQGIFVCGASSMGALRAAELAYFGMHGVGEIFGNYRDDIYTDDDEVAISHTSASDGFKSFSDAMVNIRATVAQAIQQQIITPELGLEIIQEAKQTFYPQRSLQNTLLKMEQKGHNPDEIARFSQFIQQGGCIDQKRLDAIALLTFLKSMVDGKAPVPVIVKPTLNKSIFIAELQNNLAIRPLRNCYSWLPLQEKIAQEARLLGRIYWGLRHLAGLIRWCVARAQQQGIQVTAKDLEAIQDFGVNAQLKEADGSIANDRSIAEHQSFLNRLGQIQALLRSTFGLRKYPETFPQYLNLLLQLSPQLNHEQFQPTYPITPTESKHDLELRLYCQIAFLWSLAVQLDEQPEFSLRSSTVQPLEWQILQQQGLNAPNAWQAWINKYQSKPAITLANPMQELIRLEGIVNGARWWQPFRDMDLTVNFLADALKLSGWYGVLKQHLESSDRTKLSPNSEPQAWQPLFNRWCAANGLPNNISPVQLSFWLDFSDVDDFLNALVASDWVRE